MTTKDDPAFPYDSGVTTPMPGLTKREYFAGLALQGILANEFLQKEWFKNKDSKDPGYMIGFNASVAVQFADDLIKELGKGESDGK